MSESGGPPSSQNPIATPSAGSSPRLDPSLRVTLTADKAWYRPAFLSLSSLVVMTVAVAARSVLLPFVFALVIAYVLTPLVAWVEGRGANRAVAILLVYAVVLGTMSSFFWTIAPRMGQELANLRAEAPQKLAALREDVLPKVHERLRDMGLAVPAPIPEVERTGPEPAIVARPQPDGSVAIEVGSGFAIVPTKRGFVVESAREKVQGPFDPNRFLADAVGKTFAYAEHNALEVARLGRDVIAAISRIIFVFFISLMLAAYTILTRERIFAFLISLVRPSSRQSFQSLLERMDRGLSGVVRGQLVICLVNGLLTAIGFAMVNLKYWPVLALLATVLSLIPIFGSIVSAVPAVALGLTQSFGTAVFTLLWIVGIHQLEANLLNPKIMGDAAKIHPVLVVLSLLVGEHFFQTTGALLAVPCMSMAQSIFIHFRQIVQKYDPELAHEVVGTMPPPEP